MTFIWTLNNSGHHLISPTSFREERFYKLCRLCNTSYYVYKRKKRFCSTVQFALRDQKEVRYIRFLLKFYGANLNTQNTSCLSLLVSPLISTPNLLTLQLIRFWIQFFAIVKKDPLKFQLSTDYSNQRYTWFEKRSIVHDINSWQHCGLLTSCETAI